jgi:hypothetical protein
MAKLRWTLIVAGSLLWTVTASATSIPFMAYTTMNGSACVPVQGSEGLVGYSQYGVHNASDSSSATVICPLTPTIINGPPYFASRPQGGGCWADNSARPIVTVYDRSRDADVSCSLLVLTSEGAVWQSWSVASSGFGSASQALQLPVSTTPFTSTYVLMCTLPPIDPATGYSHVAHLNLPMCTFIN